MNMNSADASLLRETPPFDVLNDLDFAFALENMAAMYLSTESREEIIRSGSVLLYLVRSGTYDLVSQDNRRLERLEQGDLFGFPSLLSGRAVTNRIDVVADGIVWTWTADVFHKLRQRSPAFERYFLDAHSRRLLREHYVTHPALPTEGGLAEHATDWTIKPISDVLQRSAVCIQAAATVREAAELMSQQQVSSLLVLKNKTLLGIVTDRDMRERVVAQGLHYATAVADIMTQMPHVIDCKESLFDALTLMGQWNIHHLPVVDENDQPVGVITVNDLMQQQRSEPVVLLRALFKASDLDVLITEAAQIPEYLQSFLRSLVGRVRDITILGRLISSLTDAITRKLIAFYEQAHGAAPVSYAWLAFESQARQDQTPDSEQANGLLLANGITSSERQWFAGLAEYVCEGLAACGIPFSSHQLMAVNPQWRMTPLEWRNHYQQWLRVNNGETLLLSMYAADSRFIAGNKYLYRQHRQELVRHAQNPHYLSAIARYINTLTVPIGLFYRIRSSADKHGDYLDIKKHGIAILNQLIRLYSLAEGLTVAPIPERLSSLQQSELLTPEEIENLHEAWYFLTDLRLQSQFSQRTVDMPTHTIDPTRLTTMQRRQLKAAFRVIKEAKQGVLYKFGRVL
ncbi:DUF294 nucleotidyltransferase-like domain-containing protein [Aliidiomarina quisquiliarum]|uniref:DUF294 nucleotidyltransferase-like domain-containing protein n=1 Tax=Aliidiomarina quisquiliarum TaxID=2938947 RepID=UPI00208EF36A|nr:DUF294 nucleotidyltransferase-like domain-containing protein [Aliidiomarina quisquiliarum]MCO4321631.1 DUF294 nucleotidyltransferase-like domain-containing protein [Aliidiomarina quisquiliarum]